MKKLLVLACFVFGLAGGFLAVRAIHRSGNPQETSLPPENPRYVVPTSWYRGDSVEIQIVEIANHRFAVALRGTTQVAICEITEASKLP